MKQFNKTITDILNNHEKCPLPLEVIPNYMGINLVSVQSISWIELDDGQLDTLTIHFIPEKNNDNKHDFKQLELSGWVSIESNISPERCTEVMVEYNDKWKGVAYFDGDGRFYTQNDDTDITDRIARWHILP